MIHLLALCPEAVATARLLRRRLGGTLHAHRSAGARGARVFDRLADRLAELWAGSEGFVVLAPAGVVVRAVAPLCASKHADPAVVACDALGRWAVALLSGHEGGANGLALAVANAIGAEPVITTTSEALRDHIVGVGCRRGADAADIRAAIRLGLRRAGVPLARVRLLSSARQKEREPGLLAAAAALGLPLRVVDHDEIRACAKAHAVSPAALRRLGLPAVAEPCALLAGRRTALVLPRQVVRGVTVAVAREATVVSGSTGGLARVEDTRKRLART